MESDALAFKIVIVCSANICRSPSAVRILGAVLPEDLARVVNTESAGVDAASGNPWCSRSAEWVASHVPGAAEVPDQHRSRRLTAAKIERADLILAADAHVRSGIVRLAPRSRERLFTIVEADALSRAVRDAYAEEGDAQDSGVRLEPLSARGGVGRLQWLVTEMDAARGLVPVTTNGHARPDPLDPHGDARGSHRETLSTIRDSVTSLAGTMRFVNEA